MRTRVEMVDPQRLFSFLERTLPFYSFDLLVHVLTDPYLSLLESLPAAVKEASRVFLDGEKRALNDAAARRLRRSGFRSVSYVDRLHAKLVAIGRPPAYRYIVVGSSNLTQRSFDNYEVVLVIEAPGEELSRGVAEFVAAVERASYPAP